MNFKKNCDGLFFYLLAEYLAMLLLQQPIERKLSVCYLPGVEWPAGVLADTWEKWLEHRWRWRWRWSCWGYQDSGLQFILSPLSAWFSLWLGIKWFYKCVTRAADICRRLTMISHCKMTQFHQSEFLNMYFFFFFFADTASYVCPFHIHTGLFLDFQMQPHYLHSVTITSSITSGNVNTVS